MITHHPIDIQHYKPGRFAYLMEKKFANDLWNYLVDENRVKLMLSASLQEKIALEPLLADLETQFDEHISSSEYPQGEICVFVNNMIKQILEIHGFEHTGCGLCSHGRYFKNAGIFRKQPAD